MQIIESKTNELVKHLAKLAKSSSYRECSGECLLYGVHLIEEAIRYKKLKYIIIEINSHNKYATLLQQTSGVKIYTVTAMVMHKLNILDGAVDCLGVAIASQSLLDKNIYNADCLILENIQDPGNLGTIMRVASASGIKNIILSSSTVDPYNPKVLRASQGILFGLNIYTKIKITQFIINYTGSVLATLPKAKSSIYELDLTKPIAWVFGNEGNGITAELLAQIPNQINIPMSGNTESLNVAMAVTVCLFETYRQRLVQ